MSFSKRLFVGMALFVFVVGGFLQLIPPPAYAATASSEAQLNNLARSLEFSDTETIKGNIGNTAITFKSKKTTTAAGVEVLTYEATNLDCNGTKAVLTQGRPGVATNDIFLRASFKNGNNCSEVKFIQTNITAASFNEKKTELGVNAGAAAADEAASQDLCDLDWGTPLSWIICPIVEIGSGLTDTVMNDFVFPFLTSVPVSTNEDDGTYKAWQNFRVLGNIMLVGTMIAVVYSQVKGDK